MTPERYIRQTILKEFGPEAQQKLTQSKVLVVGAGGLGAPVLTYLNAMGVGTLGIVDSDVVSLSNLHRQVLYNESDLGSPKVTITAEKLKSQNSDTTIITYEMDLVVGNALELLVPYDLIIDASDNFPTRYLVNDACVILNKPFIYGALHGFEGQVSTFNYQGGPTYRCLFPNMPEAHEVPNCNEHGVLGILPGIVGNLQALEAVKVLTGVGEPLAGKLLLFDGLTTSFQKINFSAHPENLKPAVLQDSYDFGCNLAMQSIESATFEALLDREKLQIVDVRTVAEYSQFHLEGSLNIPLDELENRSDAIAVSQPVYFLCQSGVRSQKAIIAFQKHQPNATLINVTGGINKLQVYAAKY